MAELIAVEDDPQVRSLVVRVLERAGHRVRAAETGFELRSLLERQGADLIVLDVTLPDEDGLSLVRFLRQQRAELGIMLLSGLGDPMDRIAGLESGADDYLVKPCEPDELVARVDMVLRRRRPALAGLTLGPWRIDGRAHAVVHADGRVARLGAGELALVQAFARHPGRVFTCDELLDLAPGRDDLPFDRSIDQRIARLRRKLGDDGRHQSLIRSIHGRGYSYPD